MGIHSNNKLAVAVAVSGQYSSSSNSSLFSLSFADYLSSKDHHPHPHRTIKKHDHKQDQGFEFFVPTNDDGKATWPKQTQVASLNSNGNGKRSPSLIVRNNSIRSGGRRVRDRDLYDEDESRSRTGWSFFRSFVSPCRECRVTKPNVIQPRAQSSKGLTS